MPVTLIPYESQEETRSLWVGVFVNLSCTIFSSQEENITQPFSICMGCDASIVRKYSSWEEVVCTDLTSQQLLSSYVNNAQYTIGYPVAVLKC
jgi:hypothetical protein